MAKVGGPPLDGVGVIVTGMLWVALNLVGPNIPIVGWVEYVLGAAGVFAGIYMVATE